VHAVAEVDRIAVQVDLQIIVEPEHGILPSIWTTVVSSSMVASAMSNSTPLGKRMCKATVIDGVRADTARSTVTAP
ncbi:MULTISPECIES: hypothetical protein, partial [unclassified Caballeronia]|uniref:hypothetical protein n=1 Tax=unclassified Caballeronia TaxID=2646786 RepID=UPI00285B92DD